MSVEVKIGDLYMYRAVIGDTDKQFLFVVKEVCETKNHVKFTTVNDIRKDENSLLFTFQNFIKRGILKLVSRV